MSLASKVLEGMSESFDSAATKGFKVSEGALKFNKNHQKVLDMNKGREGKIVLDVDGNETPGSLLLSDTKFIWNDGKDTMLEHYNKFSGEVTQIQLTPSELTNLKKFN